MVINEYWSQSMFDIICCVVAKKGLSNKVLQYIFIATQPSSHIKGSRALKKSMLGLLPDLRDFFKVVKNSGSLPLTSGQILNGHLLVW